MKGPYVIAVDDAHGRSYFERRTSWGANVWTHDYRQACSIRTRPSAEKTRNALKSATLSGTRKDAVLMILSLDEVASHVSQTATGEK